MTAPDADPPKIFVPGEVSEAHVQYLDNPAFVPYKEASYRQLGLKPGDVVLDAGCGVGIDTFAMAAMVGRVGRVIGVDREALMITEARRRWALEHYDLDGEISFVRADLTDLDEFTPDSFDVARIDRTLQHAGAAPEPSEIDEAAPAKILAELARVTRPGGTIQACEPDASQITITTDPEFNGTSQKVVRAFVTKRVITHPDIGWHLPRLFEEAGITGATIIHASVTAEAFDVANSIFHFAEIARNALDNGPDSISENELTAWLENLRAMEDRGNFRASLPIYIVTGKIEK